MRFGAVFERTVRCKGSYFGRLEELHELASFLQLLSDRRYCIGAAVASRTCDGERPEIIQSNSE